MIANYNVDPQYRMVMQNLKQMETIRDMAVTFLIAITQYQAANDDEATKAMNSVTQSMLESMDLLNNELDLLMDIQTYLRGPQRSEGDKAQLYYFQVDILPWLNSTLKDILTQLQQMSYMWQGQEFATSPMDLNSKKKRIGIRSLCDLIHRKFDRIGERFVDVPDSVVTALTRSQSTSGYSSNEYS